MIIRPHIEALGRHNPDHPLYIEHVRKQAASKMMFNYNPQPGGTWRASYVVADEFTGPLRWSTAAAQWFTIDLGQQNTANTYYWTSSEV